MIRLLDKNKMILPIPRFLLPNIKSWMPMPPRKNAINAIEFFWIGFTEFGCRKEGLSKSRKTKQNIVSSIKIINGAPKKTSGAVDDEFMVDGE